MSGLKIASGYVPYEGGLVMNKDFELVSLEDIVSSQKLESAKREIRTRGWMRDASLALGKNPVYFYSIKKAQPKLYAILFLSGCGDLVLVYRRLEKYKKYMVSRLSKVRDDLASKCEITAFYTQYPKFKSILLGNKYLQHLPNLNTLQNMRDLFRLYEGWGK